MMIHEADRTPLTAPASRPVDQTSASRWDAWQSRGDALAYTGRVRALLALSAAVTGALLFYAWLT